VDEMMSSGDCDTSLSTRQQLALKVMMMITVMMMWRCV